jgi:glutamyl-tRNA synthetase
MTVITRFAPSPTGYLHIGGARTALFNYLYAKRNNGKFLLRIEDTDKARSTKEAIDAIIYGLKWLGLEHDGEIVFQTKREARHVEVAKELVKRGKAYYCFNTAQELEAQREEAKKQNSQLVFRSKWRDQSPDLYTGTEKPVIRLKVPNENKTIIQDVVQGKVEITNDQIDDLVLLRSDGSPTYMMACVVDDHDMQVTHVIRGDDHLSNTAKQILMYQAMDWVVPTFAHIPLIHGMDGAKLSKRHGALGVEAYQEMGYLPEALNNYLLRLGWSHGNDEFISREQAIEWFDIKDINKAPSRLDFAKMDNVNSHYIKNSDNQKLVDLILPILRKDNEVTTTQLSAITKVMDSLKVRAKNINELAVGAGFLIINHPINIEPDALEIIHSSDKSMLAEIIELLKNLALWDKQNIEEALKQYTIDKNIKLNQPMSVLRALLTGKTASISVFEILSLLPKEEVMARLSNQV